MPSYGFNNLFLWWSVIFGYCVAYCLHRMWNFSNNAKQYQLGITLIREIYPRKSNVKCSLLTHEKSIVPPKNEPESLEPAVWRCFIKSLPLNFFVKSTPWQSVSCECSEFLQSTSFIENYGGNVSWW